MSYELILTEKPNAALKIAAALADGKAIKENMKGAPYYKVTRGSKDIVVGCAVGHLYSVGEREKKKGWTYPIFDIEWKESSEERKESEFSRKYLDALKKLAKDADEFTVATDYDIEGEVIGLNVLRFAFKQKDANRMKFSTLTKPDLVKAYEHKSKHLDWGQAFAGETRHFLDWLYGINLSRALTLSIKEAKGLHKILSSGRVQGPALKIIVDREKEIRVFKPVPFWQIELSGNVRDSDIVALHEEEKFWEKAKAEAVLAKTEGKKASVADVQRKEFTQEPPHPFDLTTLQTEAYRSLNIQPKDTLSMAQNLYSDGFISYPRTSSQKLPKELGLQSIIKALQKQTEYAPLCQMLLSKSKLAPNEGEKTDPAHPAIFPTGIEPKLSGKEAQLYDLIVRRFLATFGDPAVRETMTVVIDVNKENFIAKGTRTLVKGWHVFYGPHLSLKEEELPPVQKGDDVRVRKIEMLSKETQPPKRYTPASIIKDLEKRELGTKATRAAIIDNLYQRGYVNNKTIEATELGIHTVKTLEKYCPEILDEELTRQIEIEMDKIREGTKKEDEVLEEARTILTKTLAHFKQNQLKIGEELADAMVETRKEMSTLGACPTCSEGNLQIRKGKFGNFVACDKYPACTTTFKLPAGAIFKPAKKECEACKHPLIMIIRKGKRPNEICINHSCSSKQIEDLGLREEAARIESGEVSLSCPSCKEGKLVLRKSIYGQFYGCSNYPKCRFTKKLQQDKNL
ncbi:DNA topoisomerase I [Candidatus Woesearchaeota archaeon]|nr:DNA topoisomerase I [Candidatus Woesearchaeota archaeon]